MGEISSPEVVSEMVDYLVRLEGIQVAMCMGRDHGALILSLRTVCQDLNAGELMRRLIAGQGVAGGHGMMAGGRIDSVPSSFRDVQALEENLTQRLLDEMQVSHREPHAIFDE